MEIYTKQALHDAYIEGAKDIACSIIENVYHQAKFQPGNTTYTLSMHINKCIADKVYTSVKDAFPDSSVVLTFALDVECNKGRATFTVDWT